MAAPLLELRKVSKTFDGVTVVREVDLTLAPGRVHALIGHNGSGKSTLIKMLSGFHRPDAGSEIHCGGRIAFVHQDLALVLGNSVLENLAMGPGYGTRLLGPVRWRAARARTQRVIDDYGIRGRPDTAVRDLGAADRTLLAIGRSLEQLEPGASSVLVLDEPTASLTAKEVARVLPEIRRVAEGGAAVLFVSHRLDEVLTVADTVLVMRDGLLVATRPVEGLDEAALVELMLGHALEETVPPAPTAAERVPLLTVSGLRGRRLRDVSLAVAEGEIVGVTGLVGSGKTELGRLLFGAEPRRGGEVALAGRPLALRSPAEAIRAGIGYVPPERRTQGGVAELTASENVTLPGLRAFWRGGRLRARAERSETSAWMRDVGVVPTDPDRRLATFSGGNQQKLIFSKWFRLKPKLLILDEPTQGVDVRATGDLYALVVAAAERGLAVLILSSEWEDLVRLCHRVIVLDRGRQAAVLEGRELTHEAIASAAFAGQGART
jgi:ribose transport system ATP-binding protein